MRAGVVGVGRVGAAATLAMIERGVCRELVLVDSNLQKADSVAIDMSYSAPLSPAVEVRCGDPAALAGSDLVIITAGINETAGGATDKADRGGRLRLLETNAAVYRDLIPEIVAAAPGAVLLIVTDPPDPLADLARELAGHDRVFSSGTLLDSLRFRVHLARRLAVRPMDVDATVVGEHGTSEVLVWSSARVGGREVEQMLAERGDLEEAKRDVDEEVRYANLRIIAGIGASQYGIGAVTARLAEIVLRDECAVLPVGSHHERYGVTLSLPSVLGRDGVKASWEPEMTAAEAESLERSAEVLRQARARIA